MRMWQQSMIFLARHQGVKNFMQNRATMSELSRRFVGGKDVAQGGTVRLVKGAFAEGKDVALIHRSAIDASFMKLAALMLSDEARRNGFYPIFATHDDGLIDQIIAIADRGAWPKEAYEFEMLYGVRSDVQAKLVQRGEQVRLYVPFGTDWWPYAVRRVGESPKNARFLLRSLFAA